MFTRRLCRLFMYNVFFFFFLLSCHIKRNFKRKCQSARILVGAALHHECPIRAKCLPLSVYCPCWGGCVLVLFLTTPHVLSSQFYLGTITVLFGYLVV